MSNNDTPPIGYDHPTTVPTNHEPDPDVLITRGQIVFDDQTPSEFQDLVEQTLNQSDYIRVENGIISQIGEDDPEVLVRP